MRTPSAGPNGVALSDLLTVKQLAQTLHVSVRTVRSWVYKRRIPFTRLERRVYFNAGVVEGLLKANAVDPVSSGKPPGSRPCGQGGAQPKGLNHGEG